MKICVGSTNSSKINAVLDGVKAYWPTAQVDGAEVKTNTHENPVGMEQTLQGAINRARAAQKSGCDLGIGLENGVMKLNGQWVIIGAVAITDGNKEYAVPTMGAPLPRSWGQAMLAGGELRPYVTAAGLNYDYGQGVVSLLTNDMVKRDEGFAMAVKTALAPWVNPEVYQAIS